MIVTTIHIPYKYGDTVSLLPLSDIHRGSKHCDVRALHETLKQTTDETIIIGLGDWFDAIIAKDIRYRKSNDDTLGDEVLDEQIDLLQSDLEPYKGKIHAVGIGNHEEQIINRCGTNITKTLCKKLSSDKHEVKYLGYSGLIRLLFSENGGRGRTVVIRYHHGWGGGSRTQGADLTKYSKDVSHWEADIFLYGHTHRKQDDRIPRIGLVGERIVAKPKIICICGTYLKTYSSSENPTYSEVKGYPPVEIGTPLIHITPTEHWVEIKAES